MRTFLSWGLVSLLFIDIPPVKIFIAFFITAGAVAKQAPRRTTWVEHRIADAVISINLQILFND